MSILRFLASIPTVANLLIKQREAEARIIALGSELEQSKRQVQALGARIKHLEALNVPDESSSQSQSSWHARKW